MRVPDVRPPHVEAPKVEYPRRTELFGKPGQPIGTCSKCKRNFPIAELQEIYFNPKESNWYCPKCMFRRKLKESFAPKLA